MRAVICLIVLSCPAFLWAADAKTTATAKQGERRLTFGGGLGTEYEGLVIALLGSCSVENDKIATKEAWEKALKGDHLRIRFAKPRLFVLDTEKAEVEAEEIVVPISAIGSPDYIYVRNGKSYRAFAKYRSQICFFIQGQLKAMLERR